LRIRDEIHSGHSVQESDTRQDYDPRSLDAHQRTEEHAAHEPARLYRSNRPARIDHVFAAGTTFNEANFGKYAYTNLGYNIYGLALHYHLHKKWQDLLQERVFTPAGLAHTTAYVSKARAKKFKIAAPYVIDTDAANAGKMVRSQLEKTDDNMQSAGGIFMSVSDLGRWLNVNMNGGKLGGKQVFPADLIRNAHTGYTKSTRTSRHFPAMASTGLVGRSASTATKK
jgi:CubicO group peptidase (beta-lactamase class C family)